MVGITCQYYVMVPEVNEMPRSVSSCNIQKTVFINIIYEISRMGGELEGILNLTQYYGTGNFNFHMRMIKQLDSIASQLFNSIYFAAHVQ